MKAAMTKAVKGGSPKQSETRVYHKVPPLTMYIESFGELGYLECVTKTGTR